MIKWYEKDDHLSPKVIISSRIRLARNFQNYPFPNKMQYEDCTSVLNATASILDGMEVDETRYQYMPMNAVDTIEQVAMVEKHIISPMFVNAQRPKGFILSEDESMSIMINEEDHLRIQAMASGAELSSLYKRASNLDDYIEEKLDYAYHKQFGYLTACPTNLGTGLRASYMMHVPALEATGQLPIILEAIGKFGITFRGIYGESSEAIGSVFQVSNQVSLGFSELEIIENLNSVTMQVVDQELAVREKLMSERRLEFEDSIYRSYGILSQARILSSKEAMTLLSDIKLGFELGLLKAKSEDTFNVFNLMTIIQPANLQQSLNQVLDIDQRDIARATIVRNNLPLI